MVANNGLNQDKKIVIIGAGPTGLAAGYRLRELGYRIFVFYVYSDFLGLIVF